MKIIKVLILSAAAIFMCASFCACSFIGSIYPDADRYSLGNTEIKGKVEAIDVDWTSGELAIVYSDSAEGIVIEEKANKELSDDEKVHWYLDGTTLMIKYASSGKYGFFGFEKKLTLTLPSDLILASAKIYCASASSSADALEAEYIYLDSASGDMQFKNINTKKLKAGSASGRIKIDGICTGSADIDTASGNITLKLSGKTDELEIESSSGKIDLSLGEVGKLDVDSSSGNIKIEAEEIKEECEIDSASGSVKLVLPEEKGFFVRVDTASGDFESDFPFTKKGSTYTYLDGGCEIEIDTSSGDITISKK